MLSITEQGVYCVPFLVHGCSTRQMHYLCSGRKNFQSCCCLSPQEVKLPGERGGARQKPVHLPYIRNISSHQHHNHAASIMLQLHTPHFLQHPTRHRIPHPQQSFCSFLPSSSPNSTPSSTMTRRAWLWPCAWVSPCWPWWLRLRGGLRNLHTCCSGSRSMWGARPRQCFRGMMEACRKN